MKHHAGALLAVTAIPFIALGFLAGPAALLTGCKKPQSQGPLAPESRGPVHDLAAIRAGNEISLSWTVPKRGTRKLVVNGSVKVEVCRRESASEACNVIGDPLLLAPGAAGTFSESLPGALASGDPRALYYYVELLNRNGQSTGLSNRVATLAGGPPPPIRGLTAQMTDKGVELKWPAFAGDENASNTVVVLHRIEVVATPATEAVRQGFASGPPVSVQDLLVEDGAVSGGALDASVSAGKTYEYRAQRVVRVHLSNQVLELAGQISLPVQITATAPEK
jgi:hypothetical protein